MLRKAFFIALLILLLLRYASTCIYILFTPSLFLLNIKLHNINAAIENDLRGILYSFVFLASGYYSLFFSILLITLLLILTITHLFFEINEHIFLHLTHIYLTNFSPVNRIHHHQHS